MYGSKLLLHVQQRPIKEKHIHPGIREPVGSCSSSHVRTSQDFIWCRVVLHAISNSNTELHVPGVSK